MYRVYDESFSLRILFGIIGNVRYYDARLFAHWYSYNTVGNATTSLSPIYTVCVCVILEG